MQGEGKLYSCKVICTTFSPRSPPSQLLVNYRSVVLVQKTLIMTGFLEVIGKQKKAKYGSFQKAIIFYIVQKKRKRTKKKKKCSVKHTI